MCRPPKADHLAEVLGRLSKINIQEQFEEFHAKNPHIYVKIVEYARRAKAKGYEKIGIALISEIIRYTEHVPGQPDTFSFSNDFRSRYARLIMAQEPDLAGFFKVSELKTA